MSRFDVHIRYRSPCRIEAARLFGDAEAGPDDRAVVRTLCRDLSAAPCQLEFKPDAANPRGMFETASAFVLLAGRAVAHVRGTSSCWLSVAASALRDWTPPALTVDQAEAA